MDITYFDGNVQKIKKSYASWNKMIYEGIYCN